eukprot:589442-Pelagomonas_calceolata.AAC.3
MQCTQGAQGLRSAAERTRCTRSTFENFAPITVCPAEEWKLQKEGDFSNAICFTLTHLPLHITCLACAVGCAKKSQHGFMRCSNPHPVARDTSFKGIIQNEKELLIVKQATSARGNPKTDRTSGSAAMTDFERFNSAAWNLLTVDRQQFQLVVNPLSEQPCSAASLYLCTVECVGVNDPAVPS